MTRKIIAVAVLILLLAFIWGNSMASREDSQRASLTVGRFVTPFLELFAGKGNVTDHLVRKLAHFCEFAALGFDLLHVARAFGKKGIGAFGGCFLGGAAAAAIDEGIQLFNAGRGPGLGDVLLDSSGALFGLLIAGGIFLLLDGKKVK